MTPFGGFTSPAGMRADGRSGKWYSIVVYWHKVYCRHFIDFSCGNLDLQIESEGQNSAVCTAIWWHLLTFLKPHINASERASKEQKWQDKEYESAFNFIDEIKFGKNRLGY